MPKQKNTKKLLKKYITKHAKKQKKKHDKMRSDRIVVLSAVAGAVSSLCAIARFIIDLLVL